jgi:hypothetical protein
VAWVLKGAAGFHPRSSLTLKEDYQSLIPEVQAYEEKVRVEVNTSDEVEHTVAAVAAEEEQPV